MTGVDLLQAVVDTCQDIVRDASSGMSMCTKYEDAALVGWMQEHQLLGMRRLMLPLAARFQLTSAAEDVFEYNLARLDELKTNSRCLLQVTHGNQADTSGSATPSAL